MSGAGAALSRLKQGFDSPRERHRPKFLNVIIVVCHSLRNGWSHACARFDLGAEFDHRGFGKLILLDSDDILLHFRERCVTADGHDFHCRTSGVRQTLARRLAQPVGAIIADLAVIADGRLQPSQIAPVGELVAKCRWRGERLAEFGQQEGSALLRGIASSAACSSGSTRIVSTLPVLWLVLLGRHDRRPFLRCWRPIRCAS